MNEKLNKMMEEKNQEIKRRDEELEEEIKNDIKDIINDSNINNQLKKIKDIYNKLEYPGEIIIRYKINKDDKEINIFSNSFIDNNKNKCKIIYEEKEYEIKNTWTIDDNFKNKILEIKLK